MAYLRWYAKLRDVEFPWADEAFAALAPRWRRPAFFPADGFALPWRPDGADPVTDGFPAKGIFVSARGARTRAHVDPWASDAILIQLFGRKSWKLWRPGRAASDTPDEEWETAVGDAVLVPAGWTHDVVSLTDAVSLTWNFVHRCTSARLAAHLRNGPTDEEDVLRFFLGPDAPTRSWHELADRVERA